MKAFGHEGTVCSENPKHVHRAKGAEWPKDKGRRPGMGRSPRALEIGLMNSYLIDNSVGRLEGLQVGGVFRKQKV